MSNFLNSFSAFWRHHVLWHMHGPLRLSCVLLANYVPKCQLSSGQYGPIFCQFFHVSLPINVKCVLHLVKSRILSNQPKSVPFVHQRLGVSIISLIYLLNSHTSHGISQKCFTLLNFSWFCILFVCTSHFMCTMMFMMYRIIFQQNFTDGRTIKHAYITMQFIHNYIVSHVTNHNYVKV